MRKRVLSELIKMKSPSIQSALSVMDSVSESESSLSGLCLSMSLSTLLLMLMCGGMLSGVAMEPAKVVEALMTETTPWNGMG